MALASEHFRSDLSQNALIALKGTVRSFPIPHESQQDLEAVFLDIQLLRSHAAE
jgi:hypothetical protein